MEYRIVQLQMSLYKRALEGAQRLATLRDKKIQQWAKVFDQSIPEQGPNTSLANIVSSANQARVILYGDFHTLRQSQRGFIRLIRSYQSRYRRQKIVLALECFSPEDQPSINGFLSGRISEDVFLQQTDFHKYWGFSWPNYRMILQFAKDRNIGVIGISTRSLEQSLEKRDSFFASQIAKALVEQPQAKIFCLVGELHLAPPHLPAKLQKQNNLGQTEVLRILANVDKLFFAKQTRLHSVSNEYIKLGPDLYCIINSPPWIKWYSVTAWEESKNIGFAEFEDESEESFTILDIDFESRFLEIAKSITSALDIPKANEFLLEHVSISSVEDTDTWIGLEDQDSSDSLGLIAAAQYNGIALSDSGQNLILDHLSLNNLAEAAGQFLYRKSHPIVPNDEYNAFFDSILLHCAGMIACKILNPRRKIKDLSFFKRFLHNNSKKSRDFVGKEQDFIAKNFVRFHEEMTGSATKPFIPRFVPQEWIEFDRCHHRRLSRCLGFSIAQAIYLKGLRNVKVQTQIHNLFTPDSESENPVAYTLLLNNLNVNQAATA